jgi:hypothetical protein
VTEQDGDCFKVGLDGKFRALTKKATTGSAPDVTTSKSYQDAAGNELAYYGRGYCQLTWWYNYASAGVLLDRGMELLLDPEKALDPATAYALMSLCMRTGKGFANGHKFTDYFSGFDRNYVDARSMVNGTDHAKDIAKIAELFEEVLHEARER